MGAESRNLPFVLVFALIPSANSFLVGYISFHPPYALLAPYSGVEAKDMSLGRLADVGQSTLVIALKIESKPFALRLQGRSIERPYSAGMTSCVPIERLLLSFLRNLCLRKQVAGIHK